MTADEFNKIFKFIDHAKKNISPEYEVNFRLAEKAIIIDISKKTDRGYLECTIGIGIIEIFYLYDSDILVDMIMRKIEKFKDLKSD